ncbi:hypothetical protein HPB48_012759 [Haemaphysalis longicornis]|uniref:Uncharacterized protein n=1 Tax=Haemaphysalis longicornis TaxID=44386 RepID=A0A9J6GA39_HAELO|nr:hypothetical protein HPB48_012759 [Haemaphysalis longicornis]
MMSWDCPVYRTKIEQERKGSSLALSKMSGMTENVVANLQMELHILQVNLTRAYKASQSLNNFQQDEQLHISLIQEP